MRTLVVSDLHLGSRLEHDVLRLPEPADRLLTAVDTVDRVVLLGDIVELAEGRTRVAFELAAPLLRRLGARVGRHGSIIVVPGNHDRALVRDWARHQGARLTPTTEVPPDATPAVTHLHSLLAPAPVRVFYPGTWLGEGMWATHGHYLDRHLFPESAFGIARGLLGGLPRSGALPTEYEHVRRPSLARLNRWLPRPAVALIDDLAELARARTMPRVPRRFLHRQFSSVIATLLAAQMQGASIPALARVVHRLGVDADRVVFGHVHRLGPLPGDDLTRWRGPGGRPQVLNTGSWVYEPLLVHRATPPHPYWPGGAVVIEDGVVSTVGLLDGLGVSALRGPARARVREV